MGQPECEERSIRLARLPAFLLKTLVLFFVRVFESVKALHDRADRGSRFVDVRFLLRAVYDLV
jgi:hypothetical protein